MKKLFLIVALSAVAITTQAQQFNIGLGGGIYSTWLVNTNVSDQGDDLNFAATFGGQAGLNMSYYFKDNLGITMGLLFTGHNQKYTGDYDSKSTYSGNSYTAKTKLRYLDIPFLIRLGGGAKGAYFEMGPQFSFLMSAKDEFSMTPTVNEWSDVNRKDNLNSSTIAGVLGFGVDIDASENVVVTTGLRLGYGFNDVTKKIDGVVNPINDATKYADQLVYGFSATNAQIKQGDSTTDGDVVGYKATNRAFGGLFISIMYKIPGKK